jgi:hypothetical protein
MAVALAKMSFLCFCLRIFPGQGIRRKVYTLSGTSPVNYTWQSWDGEHKGKCINFSIFAWAHAGINIALDVAIIGIPIPELLRLSMSLKKKVQVIMMFSVGAL